MQETKTKNKKIALALSGGGVRACFHIGLYEVLRKNGVEIGWITGTSMGSIIGAMMAMDLEPETIANFAHKYTQLDLFSLKNFNYFDEGLVKRDEVAKVLYAAFGEKTFADLKIPFACTAVDLESGDEVKFKEGSILKAVEASSAYPLIFPPLFENGQYLVDGGILDSVPALLAREIGGENLVAVDIKNYQMRQELAGQVYLKHYKKNSESGVVDFLKNIFKRKREDFKLMVEILLATISIASKSNVQGNIEKARPEVFLEPMVNVGMLDFDKVDRAIQMGREEGEKALPEILKMLG